MFLNWITCGTDNTNEKSMVVINKRKGTVSSVSENNMGKFCKEQKLGGFDVKIGLKKSRQEDSNNLKTFGAAAYKPVHGPNCSQCGRQFNPEKLHNHMKYCKGMKALAKSTNSRPKPKTAGPYSPSSASLETFLLDI